MFFPPNEDSIPSNELRDLPLIEFVRISENDHLKKTKNELFGVPIQPGRLIL
jgi:hypothetical protein